MKQALIKLHTAVFLWGFTGVLGRGISLNEGLLVWYRILITVVSLFAFLKLTKKITKVQGKQRWQLFANGSLLALHWCCFYGSIKFSNVSIALTCLSASGLFTAVLEPIINKKAIALPEVTLGMIGMCGIVLIFHFDPHYKIGIVVGLIATLLCCLYTIFSEKQVVSTEPKTVMLYQLSGGLVWLTILMPVYLYYRPATSYLPQGKDWVLLIIMSWACTIVAINLALQSLKKLSAFTQNLTLNLEPVYGIVLAFAIYHENKNLSSGFFFGFGLIALAVLLQMIRVLRKPKPVSV